MAKGPVNAEAAWRERLTRYEGCGLTVEAFCRQEGVSASSFYRWKRRLGKSGPSSPAQNNARDEAPLFVPVQISPPASAEVRIVLPGGAVVHVPEGAAKDVLACCIRSAASAQTAEGETC